jgi:glycosyltransferase involved in cell wall biosynthesis
MTGFLSGEKLERVIADAKALLVPSIWYENCPLSILEAHSMGTPVITMARGGMAELVKDNVNGILFNSPTAESLCDAIRKTGEESFKEITENCMKNKDDIILREAYCDDLLKVYDEVIRGKKNA